MTQKAHQLAQYNIIKLKDTLDSPVIKEFRDFLAPVNLLAEESAGFVWRLKDATETETPYEDPLIFVNMSVWVDYKSLRDYTYQTVHSYFLKSRKKWSDQLDGYHAVMWYIDKGAIPTVREAKAKLDLLNEKGSGSEAFSMTKRYRSDGSLITKL